MPTAANALVARVSRAFQRVVSPRPERVAVVHLGPMGPAVDLSKTTADDPAARRMSIANRLAGAMLDPFEQSRLERYREYREGVEESELFARALEVRSAFAFGGSPENLGEEGFSVSYGSNARAQVKQIVEQTSARLRLDAWARGIHHEGLWLGDSFTELGFGGAPLCIVTERHKAPERVRVMEYDGRISHYEVAPKPTAGMAQHSTWDKARLLEPWQMIHYSPRRPRGSRYGWSMFHSGRKVRRGSELYDDTGAMLAARRAAGDIYFLWPVPANLDQTKLEEFVNEARTAVARESVFDQTGTLRQRVASWLDTLPRIMPFRVVGDLDTKPTVVESEPVDLSKYVPMLEHQQRREVIVGGVPAAFLGLDRDVNAKATVGEQGLGFAITIRHDQMPLAESITDVYVRALLIGGYVPEPGEIVVTLPRPSAFDEMLRAEVFQKRAAGVASLVQAGAPLSFALREGFGLSDEQLAEVALMAADGARVEDVMREAARKAREDLEESVRVDAASRLAVPENQIG